MSNERSRKVKAASGFLARAHAAMVQAAAARDPDAVEAFSAEAETWLSKARRCLGEPAAPLRARVAPREGRSFKPED